MLAMGKWESGRVGEWESGRVGEWDSGRVGQWESGRVGEWESGTVGQWESGKVRKWESGKIRDECLGLVLVFARGLNIFKLLKYFSGTNTLAYCRTINDDGKKVL